MNQYETLHTHPHYYTADLVAGLSAIERDAIVVHPEVRETLALQFLAVLSYVQSHANWNTTGRYDVPSKRIEIIRRDLSRKKVMDYISIFYKLIQGANAYGLSYLTASRDHMGAYLSDYFKMRGYCLVFVDQQYTELDRGDCDSCPVGFDLISVGDTMGPENGRKGRPSIRVWLEPLQLLGEGRDRSELKSRWGLGDPNVINLHRSELSSELIKQIQSEWQSGGSSGHYDEYTFDSEMVKHKHCFPTSHVDGFLGQMSAESALTET